MPERNWCFSSWGAAAILPPIVPLAMLISCQLVGKLTDSHGAKNHFNVEKIPNNRIIYPQYLVSYLG